MSSNMVRVYLGLIIQVIISSAKCEHNHHLAAQKEKLTMKFYIRFDQFHNINNNRKKGIMATARVCCLLGANISDRSCFHITKEEGESDNESEWCESDESDSDSDSVDIRSISSASWDCTEDDEGEF